MTLECGHPDDNRLASKNPQSCATCALLDSIEWRDAELTMLDPVIDAARALAAVGCQCAHAWTRRKMHDPHGCTYQDATTLREALAVYDKAHPARVPLSAENGGKEP